MAELPEGPPRDSGSACASSQSPALAIDQDVSMEASSTGFGASSGSTAQPGGAAVGASGGAQENCDLLHFHQYAVFEQMELAGAFTKIKGLAKAIFGKVILARWDLEAIASSSSAASQAGGTSSVSQQAIKAFHAMGAGPHRVVVKKMATNHVENCRSFPRDDRQAHQRGIGAEDALNEIGVLSYLAQQEDQPANLLRMLGCFRDPTDTWLVTEFCDGGELFQICANGATFDEPTIRSKASELLQGVRHLHRHNIGHRDISLENVLVQNNVLKLMDFGQACLLRSTDGCPNRYFRITGKEYYRSSECYIPRQAALQAECPGGHVLGNVVQLPWPGLQGYVFEVVFAQDAVAGQPSQCQPVGYMVEPVDMFAVGVCIFIMHAQLPPWGMALPVDDRCRYVVKNGLRPLLTAWKKPLLSRHAMDLLSGLLNVNVASRATLQQCLDSAWFAAQDVGQASGE